MNPVTVLILSLSGSKNILLISISVLYSLVTLCRILANGTAEYSMNDKVVSFQEYNALLEGENILTKARNFLVFQGDIENLASKSPRELTKLFEQISGSDELRDEYDRLKVALEKAIQNSAASFSKKKTMNAEYKTAKEQKNELTRFDELSAQKAGLFRDQMLIKLKKIEEAEEKAKVEMQSNQTLAVPIIQEIQTLEEESKGLKKEHGHATLENLKIDKSLKREEKLLLEETATFSMIEESVLNQQGKITNIKQALHKNEDEIVEKTKEIESLRRELEKMQRTEAAFLKEQKKNN